MYIVKRFMHSLRYLDHVEDVRSRSLTCALGAGWDVALALVRELQGGSEVNTLQFG